MNDVIMLRNATNRLRADLSSTNQSARMFLFFLRVVPNRKRFRAYLKR
jgi:hypothetical protein